MDIQPEVASESLKIRHDMEAILETLSFMKTEAYSQAGNTKDLVIFIKSEEFDFLKSYLDTSTIMSNVISILEKASEKLDEWLSLLASVEDIIEEIKLLYRHIFHVKNHIVLFEVFYLLDSHIDAPSKDAFLFLSSFMAQMVTLKNHSEDMRKDLKCTSFDFENLNEIFSLIQKRAKHDNLFNLAEQEANKFYHGYVEKQLYWHLRYYWDLLSDWMEDLQCEIAHKGAYQGIDASDGLHPIRIQDMIMYALSELSMMRNNYWGLKDMLMEIIRDEGTGAGKFLQGFKDAKEKEMVLYAIAASIPEDYSKELWGLLRYFKEIKMYKQVRNMKNISQFKNLLGDIYDGTIKARNFIRMMKQLQ